MAQVSSNQVQTQPTRSFSVVSLLPLIFGVVMLVGTFLPQTSTVVPDLKASTTPVLILSVIAIGLALWTVYDVRARFVSGLAATFIGIVAVLSLFNYVSVLSTSLTEAGAVHVGIGFWVSLVGALGLILQIFLPRPVLKDIQVYGESGLRDFMARLGILGELLGFLWKRKLYWLIPMVLTLGIFIVLIIAGSNSAIAPFIYTLF
ncbi:MAG TPA: DUF5989 family protein [Phototrophicaceae bacterium]|jgi:hypothetical protein|nr:DUF5989 family protein [Phototrophicaceae bacterium]